MTETNQEGVTTDVTVAEERILCVRLPLDRYRTLRTVAVTRDMTNAQVVSWAVDLLDRHVQAGGKL